MKKEWKVDVTNQHPMFVVNKKIVVRLVQRGLLEAVSKHKLTKKISELSVVFTDDKEIRQLNKIYRYKNKATDVLSFSQLEGEEPNLSESLGDIIISLDTALKQSKKYKVTLEQEVLRLLVHGILHLLGYDHEGVSEQDAENMRAWEDLLHDKLKGAWRKEWIKTISE